MALRVPALVEDPVNTGLKTLFWMAWWLISRVGCHWSKTGSLVLYLRLSIYTLVTCKLPWSVLLHTCVWSTRHGWGPCSSSFGWIHWFVLLYSYTRVSPVKDWRWLSLFVWCSDVDLRRRSVRVAAGTQVMGQVLMSRIAVLETMDKDLYHVISSTHYVGRRIVGRP